MNTRRFAVWSALPAMLLLMLLSAGCVSIYKAKYARAHSRPRSSSHTPSHTRVVYARSWGEPNPRMRRIDGTNIEYVDGIDRDIFFYKGVWYRYYGRGWYRCSTWGGRWMSITIRPAFVARIPRTHVKSRVYVYRWGSPGPQLSVIQNTDIYYVREGNEDFFRHRGIWYRYHSGRWYQTRTYGGRWVAIGRPPAVFAKIPPGHTKYRVVSQSRHKPAPRPKPHSGPKPIYKPAPRPKPHPGPKPIYKPAPRPEPRPAPKPIYRPHPGPAPGPVKDKNKDKDKDKEHERATGHGLEKPRGKPESSTPKTKPGKEPFTNPKAGRKPSRDPEPAPVIIEDPGEDEGKGKKKGRKK